MDAPVSVIIPCYNGKDVIERAIRSVYEQTWRPAELIVVDDGSEEETVKFLRELEKRYNGWMKLIELGKNSGGPSIPRNVGWDDATQPYIAFLDQDDAWVRHKVEIQLNFMLNNPEFDFTGHNMKIATDYHEPEYNLTNFKWKKVSKRKILLKNYFYTSTMMLKRDLPFRLEPSLKYCDDYHLWIRLLLSDYKGIYIDLPLALKFKPHFGHSGPSGELWRMEKDELKVYFDLLKNKMISGLVFPFLITFSLLKFIRRAVISLKWK